MIPLSRRPLLRSALLLTVQKGQPGWQVGHIRQHLPLVPALRDAYIADLARTQRLALDPGAP